MKTINVLNAFVLPQKNETPYASGDSLIVSSAAGYGDYYVTVEIGDKSCTVLASQLKPAVQNANNCVRGCMQVTCELNTFDETPKSYEERQKPKISETKLYVKSTAKGGFVRIELGNLARIVRHEEAIAAIENSTKR